MSLWDKLTGNDQRKRAEEERQRLEVARQMSLRRAQQSSNPQVAQQATQKLQNNGWQVQQKQAPSLKQNIENAVGTVGLGLGRSGIGTAQGLSGMYDLMTPGKGTNRFSQSLDTRAKRFDQIQKDQNRSSMGYKSAQFLGDAGTFLAGGGLANAAVKGASKAPTVVKLANNKAVQTAFKPIAKTNSIVNKGINAVAQKGAAGRITAVAAKNAKMPGNLIESAVDTGIGVGQMASKGQQVRPQDVALQAAISTGFNVGLPGTAQGVKEVFRMPSRANIPFSVVRPEHMNAQDVADLRTWRGAMGTGATMNNPDMAYNGRRASAIAGVDYRDPDAMDKVLKARRQAEDAKMARQEKLQAISSKINELPANGANARLDAGSYTNTIPNSNKSVNPIRGLEKLKEWDKKRGNLGALGMPKDQPTIKNMFGEEVPNPAYKPDPLEALKAEARKYKSAEEFVKNNFVAHGTNKEISGNLQPTNGWYGKAVYTTDDLANASGRNGGGVTYFVNKPQGKLLEINAHGSKGGSGFTPQQYNAAIKNGYDGLKINHDDGKTWYAMFNEQTPHTKQQLTDLYNQATAPKTVETAPKIKFPNKPISPAEIKAKAKSNIASSDEMYAATKSRTTKNWNLDKAKNDQYTKEFQNYVRENADNIAKGGKEWDIANELYLNATEANAVANGFDRWIDSTPEGRFFSEAIEQNPMYSPKNMQDDLAKNPIAGQTDIFSAPKPTLQDALEGRDTRVPTTTGRQVSTTERVATATKPQVGTATSRVVPQISEEMALTKTGASGAAPPNKPPVDTPPPLLGTGKQKATRYASQTVPESEFVSKPIKDTTKKNAPLYTPENEQVRYNQALTKYEKVGRDKFENDLYEQLNGKKGTISSSTVAEAQTLAAKLDAEGNYSKASEIYDKISEHLTASGQTIQAAAIMSRRSPEGLRKHAVQVWKKAGVKVTPEAEKELVNLTQAVKKAQTPEAKAKAVYKVNEHVKKQVPDNVWNKSVNIWRAGLLTSPVTTAGNVMANTGETLIRKGFVNPVSTAADAAMGLFTGKRTMATADLGSGTKGLVKGTKSLPEYMKTGYQESDAILKSKYENGGTINYGQGKLGKGLGAYVNGTYRLMGVADAPFRQTATSEVLSSLANAEAINKGLKGQAKKQFVQEYLANPPKEAVQRASDEGMRATFQNDTLLNDIASSVKQKLENGHPAAKALSDFVMPFVRTPSAIAMRLIERTPVGVGKEIASQIVNVKSGKPFDQRAMSQAIGNGSFGAVAIGAGMALANADMMTYGYPTDEQERKLWDSEGKQPYSVKVGDRWYSLNYLQPFGTLLAIGGQAKKDMDNGLSKGEATTKALSTAGQSIQEQSFLKGINGILSAVSDPEREARKYMEQTFSSLTPNFIRAGARAADEVQRKPTSIPESIASGIPGLRGNVPTKNDMFGEPLPAKDTFLNQYVNPLRPSKVRGNDTVAEIRRLKDAELGTMPTESNANVFGKSNLLDKKQLSDLNAFTAKKVSTAWNELIKSPDYKSLSDEDKKKTLDSAKRDYSAVAKAEWAAKNNKISDEWSPKLTANQKKLASGETPDYLKPIKEKNAKDEITSKYSQEVQDFSKLTNAEKNEYFKRDPAKAKELYDQAKLMDAELGKKASKATKTSTKKTTAKTSTKKTSSRSSGAKTAKRGSLPNWKNISPSKGLVNTRVSSVKHAPVKKPVYKGKKVVRKIA